MDFHKVWYKTVACVSSGNRFSVGLGQVFLMPGYNVRNGKQSIVVMAWWFSS